MDFPVCWSYLENLHCRIILFWAFLFVFYNSTSRPVRQTKIRSSSSPPALLPSKVKSPHISISTTETSQKGKRSCCLLLVLNSLQFLYIQASVIGFCLQGILGLKIILLKTFFFLAWFRVFGLFLFLPITSMPPPSTQDLSSPWI